MKVPSSSRASEWRHACTVRLGSIADCKATSPVGTSLWVAQVLPMSQINAVGRAHLRGWWLRSWFCKGCVHAALARGQAGSVSVPGTAHLPSEEASDGPQPRCRGDHSGATHEAQVSEVPAKAWSQGAVLGVHSLGGTRVLLSAGEAGRVL